jgi:hypothetical protein
MIKLKTKDFSDIDVQQLIINYKNSDKDVPELEDYGCLPEYITNMTESDSKALCQKMIGVPISSITETFSGSDRETMYIILNVTGTNKYVGFSGTYSSYESNQWVDELIEFEAETKIVYVPKRKKN